MGFRESDIQPRPEEAWGLRREGNGAVLLGYGKLCMAQEPEQVRWCCRTKEGKGRKRGRCHV